MVTAEIFVGGLRKAGEKRIVSGGRMRWMELISSIKKLILVTIKIPHNAKGYIEKREEERRVWRGSGWLLSSWVSM